LKRRSEAKQELIQRINNEMARGKTKWGKVDRTPVDFVVAATEELGEVAHAVNHSEGADRIKQEVAEVMGILSRLYEMVDKRGINVQ